MADRIAEIQARAEAATKGPWFVERHQPTLTRRVVSDDHALDADLGYLGNSNQFDAEFIAHAREDIPFLLDELARVQAAADELLAERDAARREVAAMEEMAAFYSKQAAS
ncbi:hypothetical protein [Streptomyces lavendofoliae]|uniref:Ead/Ea22-like family protein n=1 Tax=Streptomyces lavendofoliae TaxID=67314 RepID=A0A918I1J8_9ACTN|nr:hypothetical protein [Streptomyces lavendofoliae]GGU52138.1 hypothetical protein GCM10010274_46320 [Streptomyces lavendofoliae]